MSIIRLHHSLVICMFLQSIVTIWGFCTLCGPNKKFPLAQRRFCGLGGGWCCLRFNGLVGEHRSRAEPLATDLFISPWTNICRDVSQVMPPRNTFTLSQVCWKSLSGTWSRSVEELLKKHHELLFRWNFLLTTKDAARCKIWVCTHLRTVYFWSDFGSKVCWLKYYENMMEHNSDVPLLLGKPLN